MRAVDSLGTSRRIQGKPVRRLRLRYIAAVLICMLIVHHVAQIIEYVATYKTGDYRHD